MKANQLSKSWGAAAFFIAALIAASCKTVPEQELPIPSTAMKLDGGARYSQDGATWKAIEVGDSIPSGSIIQTARFGKLVISLGEKTMTVTSPSGFGSGGLYDPAVHPANLLGLADDSIVKLRNVKSERLADSKMRKDVVELVLERGMIQGNVKKQSQESQYQVQFKNGVLTMHEGTYQMDNSGNVSIFDGHGEIRFPGRNLTNQLTVFQKLDAETGAITNFPPPSLDWRHDIWLAHDPFYEPWSTPPHVKSVPPATHLSGLKF